MGWRPHEEIVESCWQTLDFIKRYSARHWRTPTQVEIIAAIDDVKTVKGVYKRLGMLQEWGKIKVRPLVDRGIILLDDAPPRE